MSSFCLNNFAFLIFYISFQTILAITEYDFDPVKYSLPFPPVLKPNNKLAKAQKILVNELTAPESLLIEGNTIYTGTADGKLLKIVDGKIVNSLQLNGGSKNQTCGTYETQPICGWPHAIRRLSSEYLIVIDSYLGLYRYKFENGGNVENLMPGNYSFGVKGKDKLEKCALFNNMDVIKNGTMVLISCCSVRWDNRRAIHDFFEGKPNGRLIQYNVSSGEAQIVLSDLNFSNGVQVHPDGQSVIIAELTRARIIRYYFDGPKSGKSEIFAENLPGFPDNIKLSSNGKSFMVGMDMARHSELLTTVEKLGPYPNLRQAAVMFIPEENMRSFFGGNLLKRYGLVLELDLNGKIINDWQDPTGTIIPGVSEANDNGTHLILGSSSASYISIVPK